MSNINEFRNSIADVAKSIYKNANKNKILSLIPMDANQAFKFCVANRLEFLIYEKFSSKNLLKCNVDLIAVETYERRMQDHDRVLSESIKNLATISNGNNWVLIKTLSSYPHYTSDIDVLVESKNAKIKFENLLIKSEPINKLCGKNMLEIDFQYKVAWTKSCEISHDFAWSNTQPRNKYGVVFNEPNPTFDLLMRMGHIAFELAELRLGELLHMFHQAQYADFAIMEAEAERCGWSNTYNSIYKLIFVDAYNSISNDNIYGSSTRSRSISFPHSVSYLSLAKYVFEKRAWEKLWGARLLLKDRLFS